MVKGAKDGYGAARKTESEKKAELRAVQEKLKAAFTVLEEMGAKRDEEGGGVNALYEEKKALHEEVRGKQHLFAWAGFNSAQGGAVALSSPSNPSASRCAFDAAGRRGS